MKRKVVVSSSLRSKSSGSNKREELRSDGSRRKSGVHVNREKHGPTMSGDDGECAHRILVLFE